MSEVQIVSVDVRKLGLGMSHAFQGMAEVCASLGVPKEDLLGAVDEGEKAEAEAPPSSLKQKLHEQAAKSKVKTSGTQEVKENADKTERPAVDVADDADGGGDVGGNTADAAASVKESGRSTGAGQKTPTATAQKPPTATAQKPPTATADDITRILAAKVQQKKIKAADAKALLEKYGAKSVSTLDPQYYDAVLEEASSM